MKKLLIATLALIPALSYAEITDFAPIEKTGQQLFETLTDLQKEGKSQEAIQQLIE